jgi:hypothetical protein
MKNLSRQELQMIKGGKQDPGSCTESCGVGENIVSCTSSSGNCSRSGNVNITCDSTIYGCPQQ